MKKNTDKSGYAEQDKEAFRPPCKGEISPKPLILVLETSGRKGSTALACGEELLEERIFFSPMKHSAELFPAIYGLLERHGKTPKSIDQVYISVGPGSFTGLRISVTFAKTMHLATKAKIVAIDTLDTIARNADDYMKNEDSNLSRIGVVLDAKRGQFFAAAYENRDGVWHKILPDSLMTPEQFIEHFKDEQGPLWLLGEGLVYYKDSFKADFIRFLDEKYWWPLASKVHLLGWEKAAAGEFADPLSLVPYYLRGPDAIAKPQMPSLKHETK